MSVLRPLRLFMYHDLHAAVSKLGTQIVVKITKMGGLEQTQPLCEGGPGQDATRHLSASSSASVHALAGRRSLLLFAAEERVTEALNTLYFGSCKRRCMPSAL
jgi:hypothetical protein